MSQTGHKDMKVCQSERKSQANAKSIKKFQYNQNLKHPIGKNQPTNTIITSQVKLKDSIKW